MSAVHRDNALDALCLPFAEGTLHWPGDRVLFLRARDGAGLRALGPRPFAATQPFAPEAERLQRIQMLDEEALPQRAYALVLALPPRQREEARALLANACAACAPGGIVVAAAANDEGAKSREAELKQLAGAVSTQSKHHSRVFHTLPGASFDLDTIERWRRLAAPRRIASEDVPGGGFLGRPGVFAWDRVDAASRLLASHLPTDLHGRIADFGAGWGYLSMEVLARCPRVASLDLYEADARALALARGNLRDAGVPVGFHWQDVARGVDARFDAIVCNPPFHALGRGERPDIGRAFIASAANALAPGGRLWLVANRHLPYEGALAAGFASVRIVAQQGGFKIVEARKS